MVIHFLDKDSAKRNDSFRNSEWGLEEAEALAREVRVFKVPGGKDGKIITLGDYIDKTPADLISKVMLEEIVFDTWYGGRTVLLGDGMCISLTRCFECDRKNTNLSRPWPWGCFDSLFQLVTRYTTIQSDDNINDKTKADFSSFCFR